MFSLYTYFIYLYTQKLSKKGVTSTKKLSPDNKPKEKYLGIKKYKTECIKNVPLSRLCTQ